MTTFATIHNLHSHSAQYRDDPAQFPGDASSYTGTGGELPDGVFWS